LFADLILSFLAGLTLCSIYVLDLINGFVLQLVLWYEFIIEVQEYGKFP